jgi:uncharacterized protein (DUF4415 family)
VTLLLDNDLIAHFQAMGTGWPKYVNDVLRQSAGLTARG